MILAHGELGTPAVASELQDPDIVGMEPQHLVGSGDIETTLPISSDHVPVWLSVRECD